MAILYVLSIISAEILLMLMFGTETIQGLEALLLTFICSLPFAFIC